METKKKDRNKCLIKLFSILLLISCSVPKHNPIDHRYDTPHGYYQSKPYYKIDDNIINISQIYQIDNNWFYDNKLIKQTPAFLAWLRTWDKYLKGK